MNKKLKTIMMDAMLAAFTLFAAGCANLTKIRSPLAKHETGFAQANGITIAYVSFGPTDRETVLLIAGSGMQLIDWPVGLVEELVRRGYRVITFDNRDVGLSTLFTEAGLPD